MNNKKSDKRCCYSYKVTEGREVVLTEYAKDYVLKQDFFELVRE